MPTMPRIAYTPDGRKRAWSGVCGASQLAASLRKIDGLSENLAAAVDASRPPAAIAQPGHRSIGIGPSAKHKGIFSDAVHAEGTQGRPGKRHEKE
jgi:hypothetical protein